MGNKLVWDAETVSKNAVQNDRKAREAKAVARKLKRGGKLTGKDRKAIRYAEALDK